MLFLNIAFNCIEKGWVGGIGAGTMGVDGHFSPAAKEGRGLKTPRLHAFDLKVQLIGGLRWWRDTYLALCLQFGRQNKVYIREVHCQICSIFFLPGFMF